MGRFKGSGVLGSVVILALLSTACDGSVESPASPDVADRAPLVAEEGMVFGEPSIGPGPDVRPPHRSPTATSEGRVLPARFETTLGNGNNFFPFSKPQMRYQQVFPASEVGGPLTLHGLCLRPGNYPFGSGRLVQQVTVKIGPTNRDPDNIGASFDANYSASPVTVFSGAFEMPTTGIRSLDAWDACMDFTTPYVHFGGNLLLEVVNTSDPPIHLFDTWKADYCFGRGCNTTRLWAHDPTAPVAIKVRRDQGLVIRLAVTPGLPPSTTPPDRLGVQIRTLVDSGALSRGQGAALLQKLGNALRQAERGQEGAALNLVDTIVRELENLVAAGVLTPAEAGAALALARDVRSLLDPASPTLAYVANWDGRSNSVSILDVATETVTKTIPVGGNPRAIAMAPDGSEALVANQSSSFLSRIDVASGEVGGQIAVGTGPLDVAFAPDGSAAYVVRNAGSFLVVDPAAGSVVNTIPVDGVPIALAVTPDGARAVVAGYLLPDLEGIATVIDVASRSVLHTIPVGARPLSIAISPDGATAYTGNFGANSVSVIDIGSGTVTDEIPVGAWPEGVAVAPDGATAYVANALSQSISVLDLTSGVVTHTIALGSRPGGLAFTSGGSTAYVTHPFSDEVSIIDVATRTVINVVAVGDYPLDVAFTR